MVDPSFGPAGIALKRTSRLQIGIASLRDPGAFVLLLNMGNSDTFHACILKSWSQGKTRIIRRPHSLQFSADQLPVEFVPQANEDYSDPADSEIEATIASMVSTNALASSVVKKNPMER